MKKGQKGRPAARQMLGRTPAVPREKPFTDRATLSEAALERLARGWNAGDDEARGQDPDDLAGTWVKSRDFDRALRDMHHVDPEMWK